MQADHFAQPRDLGLAEALENALGAEMDFGRRPNQRVDASLDHVGARPGDREVHLVRSVHANSGRGEREVVGHVGAVVA